MDDLLETQQKMQMPPSRQKKRKYSLRACTMDAAQKNRRSETVEGNGAAVSTRPGVLEILLS